MRLITLAILAGACALGGCMATSPVEEQYGEAVRQMINAQVYDPATLTNPSSKPVEGADPDMVNAAITTFREHVARPEEVGQGIVINVGGGQ